MRKNDVRNLSQYASLLFLISLFIVSCKPTKKYDTWQVYGGNKEANHYSSLNQIDTSNVSRLQVAWTYHTNDADSNRTQIQVNPIMIDSVLYGVSPKLKLFALNAATGKEKWVFNPMNDSAVKAKGPGYFSMNVCRGVTYYTDGKDDKRIFYSANSQLYCINAITGKPIKSFGENGTIDLHNDLGRDVSNLYVSSTTPGIIYKDLIIIGTRVAEEAAAAPGYIRAYDVHNGKLRWVFHTIPQPGEFGYDSWNDKDAWKHIGGVNTWSGLVLMKRKEFYLRQSVLRPMIFMEVKDWVMIFLPIVCWQLMQQQVKGYGIFKQCIMICGTGICRQLLYWLLSLKDGKKIDAIAQTTKVVLSFFSTGIPETRYTLLLKLLFLLKVNFLVKSLHQLSRYQLGQNRLQGSH